MPFSPLRPSLLIFQDCLLQFLHRVFFRIFREIDTHFKGSNLLMIERRHPDRQGSEGETVAFGQAGDGELNDGVSGFLSGIVEMESVADHLAHQQARAVTGNIDNPSGERAGNVLSAVDVDHIHVQGEIVDCSRRSSVFDSHVVKVCVAGR